MNRRVSRRYYYILIYLISCALEGKTPDKDLLHGVDLDAVRELADNHTVSSLAISALSSIGMASNQDIEKGNMAIRKIMLLDAERNAIISELEKNGIRYLPLKGIILKDLYPKIGLRQMSDNDILFDPAHRRKVREIMVNRGYKVKVYEIGHHDVYIKKPVYNFEMHTALFSQDSVNNFGKYFEKTLDTAVKDDSSSYGYKMSDEDHYLYIKAHEYKHWISYGTGLRSLVDTYVYLKAKSDSLDRKYIDAELHKLGMLEYEKMTVSLAMRIFDNEIAKQNVVKGRVLSREEVEELDNFLFYGTYGTVSRKVITDLDKNTASGGNHGIIKIKYFFKGVFPPLEFYKNGYPFFYKHKILLPVAFFIRLGRMIFVHPKDSFSKLKAIITHKKK